mgnify:CR=1 FL=1
MTVLALSPGMVDEPTESDPPAQETTEIVKRRIDPDSGTAEYAVLEIVAELEDKEIEALPSLYEQVGHFVEMLFQDPPALEAQMEISFSYAGYRIRLTQHGQVTVLKVKNSIEDC